MKEVAILTDVVFRPEDKAYITEKLIAFYEDIFSFVAGQKYTLGKILRNGVVYIKISIT